MSEEQIPTATEFLDMPAQEIRHYLDSGKIPPELSEEQIAQLPPGTEYSYAMARASAGDQFWIARIGSWVEGVKTATEAKEERREQISSYRDVEYREGVPASDFNYLSYDHAELKSYVEPINAADITAYSDTYHDLHKLLQRLSEDLREAVTKSQSGWEGEAADSAHGYFTSLADWSESNSQNAHIASDIIAAESSAASTAKNSMPEPIPFDLEKEMESWGSNPLTTIEQISKTFEKWEESRAAHEQAAEVMHRYDAELQEAGNKQPVFAEPPSFGGGSAESSVKPSGVIQVPDTSATGGGTKASGYAGVPGGSVSPSTGGGGYGGGGGLGAPSPTPPPGGGPSTGAGVVPPVTRPSGLNPGGGMTRPPAGGRGSQRSGFGPGGMGAVPAAGLAGGFGPGGGGGGGSYGGGRVPGAGFGPGGGAGGAGGAGAGSGAATGARPMGGPAAAGPGAAAAAAGAAGRGGMGAAPMGAGAGAGKGGQGGEDNEHQRPTYLVEADPDDVFGTDQRTAPPVIGA